MTVKVVTDSSSDIPLELVKDLGITVIPLYIQFGTESLRDRVDISDDVFYQRLVKEADQLTTSVAPPGEVFKVYQNLAKETDQILSLHLSSKLSKAYEVGLQAKEMVEKEKKCKIEVIDSEKLAMGLGLLVIFAAKLAKEGKDLKEIVTKVKEAIPHIHLLGILDTLEYALRGGRLAKISGLLEGVGEVLKVRHVLTLKEGEVSRAGLVRAAKKKERMLEFIKEFPQVKEIAVEYSTGKEEAEKLMEKIIEAFPVMTLYLSRITPVLGAHFGPGALTVILREED